MPQRPIEYQAALPLGGKDRPELLLHQVTDGPVFEQQGGVDNAVDGAEPGQGFTDHMRHLIFIGSVRRYIVYLPPYSANIGECSLQDGIGGAAPHQHQSGPDACCQIPAQGKPDPAGTADNQINPVFSKSRLFHRFQ